MNFEHQEQLRGYKEKLDSCMAKIESHMDADHAEIALIRTQLDNHLSIYANNGKELAAVKTNLSWLMKFFWIFMTPIAAGIVYLVIHK